MRYRLRLLSDTGHKLGTFEFRRGADSEAIASAIEHQVDGPVEVWAICHNAAWLLYRSRINSVPTSYSETRVLPLAQATRRARSSRRFVRLSRSFETA